MKEPITLALEIFQEDHIISLASFCKIPQVKEGYIFVYFGVESAEKAFWKGLTMVLKPLLKTYRDHSIHLAFSKIWFSLHSGPIQAETIRMLEQFPSYDFIPYEQYDPTLKIVNRMGLEDNKQLHILHGYNSEEFENRKIQSIIKEEPSKNLIPYYGSSIMPESGVVIDFEATSTILKYAKPLEVAAIKFRHGEIIDQFHSLINTGKTIPKQIRLLTGINQIEHNAAPRSYEVFKSLIDFMKDEDILCGHNVRYDHGLFEHFLSRYKLKGPNISNLLCTRQVAKTSQIIVSDYKLETLLRAMNIVNERPHRAMPDAMATFQLMNSLFQQTIIGLNQNQIK